MKNIGRIKGETVKTAIERVATAAAKRLYKPELKESFIELIENGWMSLSSPIWANMGTERGLPISCFNVYLIFICLSDIYFSILISISLFVSSNHLLYY